MDLVSDDEGETYGQQTEDIPFIYLHEDEIPPPYIEILQSTNPFSMTQVPTLYLTCFHPTEQS